MLWGYSINYFYNSFLLFVKIAKPKFLILLVAIFFLIIYLFAFKVELTKRIKFLSLEINID